MKLLNLSAVRSVGLEAPASHFAQDEPFPHPALWTMVAGETPAACA